MSYMKKNEDRLGHDQESRFHVVQCPPSIVLGTARLGLPPSKRGFVQKVREPRIEFESVLNTNSYDSSCSILIRFDSCEAVAAPR